VGSVGSGKTTLLHTLLSELLPTLVEESKGACNIELNGDIAYAGQEAFIVNATLRDNILFGKEFDQAKYSVAIEASCLRSDLDVLPGGDLTEIGAKGINLSGGSC